VLSSPGCSADTRLNRYIHNIRGADLTERARRGDAYPVADGDFEHPR